MNEWDNLDPYTVFFQGGEPSWGYRGATDGGHLYSNVLWTDYLQQTSNNFKDLYYIITSCVQTDLTRIRIRSGYKKKYSNAANNLPVTMLPRQDQQDYWLPWKNFEKFSNFIKDKKPKDSLKIFWKKYISQAPFPSKLYYAQGSQFGASRELLQQRTRSYYKNILQQLSYTQDPYQGYYMEWLWLYILNSRARWLCR